MNLTIISDSHGQHHSLSLPPGDMIIHAGDVSQTGTRDQVVDFLEWFSELDYQHKIFIAGNHDFFFDQGDRAEIAALIPENVVYLNDSGIEIEGLKFWGSPITPVFFNMAFNRHPGPDIQKHWNMIPEDTDILITHGPAFGILDYTFDHQTVGSEELLHRIQEIQPRYHIAGHIHEAHGRKELFGTTFINASVVDEHYRLVNAAVKIHL